MIGRGGGFATRSFEVFRVAGIGIRIHLSWIGIFLLLLFLLAAGLRGAHPGHAAASYWIAALIGSLFFFGSILLHELAHSLVALRSGIEVPSITLFLLGGVSQLGRSPENPGDELKIAIVGPLTSFALSLLFFGAWIAFPGESLPLAGLLLFYLGWINFLLGAFNLVPGFPLDGGRVFRAIAWWWTGSRTRATRWAARGGSIFGIALALRGAAQMLSGELLGGLWLVLLGFFLRTMARAEFQNHVMQHVLGDVQVGDVMLQDVVTVRPEATLREVVDEGFLAHGYRSFPVQTDRETIGILSIRDVTAVSREAWDATRVQDVMQPLGPSSTATPHEPLAAALRKVLAHDRGLVVLRDGQLAGLVTKGSLARFAEIRRLLGPAPGSAQEDQRQEQRREQPEPEADAEHHGLARGRG